MKEMKQENDRKFKEVKDMIMEMSGKLSQEITQMINRQKGDLNKTGRVPIYHSEQILPDIDHRCEIG